MQPTARIASIKRPETLLNSRQHKGLPSLPRSDDGSSREPIGPPSIASLLPARAVLAAEHVLERIEALTHSTHVILEHREVLAHLV
jgi:hypothetical protein